MMRLVPLFIILLLFSAVLLLGYMGWVGLIKPSSSSSNNSPPPTGSPPYRKLLEPLSPLIGDGDQNFDNLNQKKREPPDPNDPENEGLPSSLLSVNDDVLKDPEQDRKIELLKMRVISKLRRYIINGAKLKGHLNEYGVDFTKLKPKSQRLDRKTVLCRLKRLRIQLIQPNSSPLFAHQSFPNQPLFGSREGEGFGDITPEPLYKTCAIIPNSAAFDGSRHGIDIDSHDFIMRFNNAPVGGYESDVGSLTSLRIVNSQVVTKPQFKFPTKSKAKQISGKVPVPSSYPSSGSDDETMGNGLHNNRNWTGEGSGTEERTTRLELAGMNVDAVWSATPKFLIWDPCPYGSTLEEWFHKPEFPLFAKYFNLTAAERNRFYLLDCRVIWRLWELLQEFSFVKIHGNPPTSGFIGIMLGLQVCERVNIFEYIPSVRESSRCHYYGPKNESNPSCTYGSWHPVAAEKLFFLSLSDGTDKDIFMDGMLTIPGVSNYNC